MCKKNLMFLFSSMAKYKVLLYAISAKDIYKLIILVPLLMNKIVCVVYIYKINYKKYEAIKSVYNKTL